MSEHLAAPLYIPIHNAQDRPLPKDLLSWNDAVAAYGNALQALSDVDDHHTAFLAMHVVKIAVDTYEGHLKTRPPKEGDFANLTALRTKLVASYAKHESFVDESHIDYPALRKNVMRALYTLEADVARRCAEHALKLACTDYPPLSYSSSMDDMHEIQTAVQMIENYRALEPLFMHVFDIRPLADTLRAIAAEETKGFQDYNDGQFAPLFEDLTVRIGRLHLDQKNATTKN